jgi:TolA-binding protein
MLFRAEKILYEAGHAEARARLEATSPDSTTLMALRAGYLAVRRAAPGPYGAAKGSGATPLDRDLLRAVATAEANGARLAILAHRSDLALEAATQLTTDAGEDSVTSRQAVFMKLAAFQSLRRFEDAITEMKAILKRYPPAPPPENGDDPILVLPETIVKLRRNLGDEAGAEREQRDALVYYESLLGRPLPALLEAHVRARVLRTALDLDQPGKAFAQADDLERLVRSHSELKPMMAEVAFAKGKMRAAVDRDPSEGVAILERIGTDFPGSPFAPRALLEAGLELEKKGRLEDARVRYQAVLQRYPDVADVAPQAMYRLALVQEKMGDWGTAKATLEGIPLRYPQSQPAAEAPIAVIQHYANEGRRTAAQLYFAKALETYRGLVARDSTGRYAPLFRVKMFQIYTAKQDSTGLYDVVDDMLRHDPRHPFTARALLEVSRAAEAFGNKGRAIGYLRRFLQDFPQSPLAPDVRRRLKSLGG